MVEGTGLDIEIVNRTIANGVTKQNLSKGQFYKGVVKVEDKTIEYISYGLGDGKINHRDILSKIINCEELNYVKSSLAELVSTRKKFYRRRESLVGKTSKC
ncbi:hypothetical protein M5W75_12640 [Paenibacillus larvae]|nr:hypothetical protein [Paenibacillus larvae]MCY9750677.1 hypothetical protein [Paenibacillus larvae]